MNKYKQNNLNQFSNYKSQLKSISKYEISSERRKYIDNSITYAITITN